MFVCFCFSGSEASINLGLTETRTQRPTLGQCVQEASPLVQRVRRIREEREQFGREIERKEREIREKRARKKREREARELEEARKWPQQPEASEWPQRPEASEWPQQQEAITGPWCVCVNEVREVSLVVLPREDQCKHFDLPLLIFIKLEVLDGPVYPYPIGLRVLCFFECKVLARSLKDACISGYLGHIFHILDLKIKLLLS